MAGRFPLALDVRVRHVALGSVLSLLIKKGLHLSRIVSSSPVRALEKQPFHGKYEF